MQLLGYTSALQGQGVLAQARAMLMGMVSVRRPELLLASALGSLLLRLAVAPLMPPPCNGEASQVFQGFEESLRGDCWLGPSKP